MKFSVKAQSADAGVAHQKLEYLDLGNLGVERIQKLEKCVRLNTLIFRGNNLDFVDNLENCRQLWNLDLSFNKIVHIDGLCRFVAFGLLDLSCNQLKWSELVRLQHIHILELHLFGNPDLEKDKHYRAHVIDCLPNVWSLDGKLITSFERLQTEQFFQSSALSSHPVRHKISHNVFKPAEIRQITTKGIFSVRADNLLKNFGRNAALNVDLDRRRARYLFDNAQHDVLSHLKRTRLSEKLGSVCTPLDDIRQVFTDSPLHARTLLLFFLTALDFPLPTELIDELLNSIGRPSLELSVLLLLTLPVGMRVRIASLLFNLFKVERDAGCDDHMTASLYLSVHAVLTDRLVSTADDNTTTMPTSAPLKRNKHRSQAQKVKAYQHILAEFVSILLPYAAFLDYVRSDPDVGHLLTSALGDEAVLTEIESTISSLTEHGVDKMQIYQTLINEVLLRIRAGFSSSAENTHRPMSQHDLHLLNASQSIPRKTVPNALFVTEFLATGRACPDRAPMNLKLGRPPRRPFITAPKLGDQVLLGPQVVGKLVAKPDPETFLVYSEVILETTGALVFRTKNNDKHYAYVTLADLEWDTQNHYWRPRGIVGDKFAMHKQADDVEEGTSMALVEVKTAQQGARPSPLPSARPLLALPPPPLHPQAETFMPMTLDMKAKSAKVRPLGSSTDHVHSDHTHQHASPRASPRPPSHSSTHRDALKKSSRASSARRGEVTRVITPLPDIGQHKSRDKSPMQHRTDSAGGSRPHSCPMCSEPGSPRDSKSKDTVIPTQSVFLTLANVDGSAEGAEEAAQGQGQPTDQSQAGEDGGQQNQLVTLNLQLVPVMSDEQQQAGDEGKPAEQQTGSQKTTARKYTGRRHLAKMQPVNLRRIASFSATGAKVVLAASGGVLVSDKQDSASSPWKPNGQARDGTPPQRPSSPQRALAAEAEAVTVLPVRTVNRWLGAGRDLHEETQNKRPSTDHVPGWLADRPASMATPLASHRADTCYHDHHEQHRHTVDEEEFEAPGVRPVFHSAPLASRGFAGNVLVPTADQLYKARLGRQKAFKCEECRHRDMLRQVQLLEQLFGTNGDDDDDDGDIAVNGMLL